jgi:predicted phosphodiesterase
VRLALIADIHGNLPAFERVLADLERDRIDKIVCLGDVAVGPQPVETIERLRKVGCPTIMGNWDACMLGATPKVDGELAEMLVDASTWSTAQLSHDHLEYVRTFAETLELRLDETMYVLAFHGSPRSYDEGIFATTPEDEVEQMLSGHDAAVYACGHTHFQMFRRFAESAIINAGSVGQPFRRQREGVMHISPWAEYCVVTTERGRLSVELRRTPVDVELVVRTMLASGMPHADWWADHWAPEVPTV